MLQAQPKKKKADKVQVPFKNDEEELKKKKVYKEA